MEKSTNLITIKDTAKLYGRSRSTISKYIQEKVLLVSNKNPRDNVTDMLNKTHVEVRMNLYQHLQNPNVKLNREQKGKLLCETCGDRDEKIQKYLAKDNVGKLIVKLRQELDAKISQKTAR